MGENPPASAGDSGSDPSPGGRHVLCGSEAREPQLPSLPARAREPQLGSPRAATTEACEPGTRAAARDTLQRETGDGEDEECLLPC